MYRSFLRPLLFFVPAERAHYLTMSLLRLALSIPGLGLLFKKIFLVKDEKLGKTLFGLHFPNPVGLAAGFDKDARFYKDLSVLGFGFIEIGTITPVGQSGNPQPRLFRLPKDSALINRMGFNNLGLDAAIQNLKGRDNSLIIGGNIGKNKNTPNDEAVRDYIKCFNGLFPYVDYFVVNVSSPNTPGLRELQEKGPLLNILNTLQTINDQKGKRKPILLKIAPDLTNSQLDDIIDIVKLSKIDGIIATNTTIAREGLHTDAKTLESIGNGGLSGLPLKHRATEVIRYLHQHSDGAFPIIGAGGIMSPEDALEKLAAGASLVQVYTGFIYYGPSLVKDINQSLLASSNG
ncbi:MAG: quinone-dependent dihydroorotate dehydrogenase [Chitinophagales bacterium]|nr:quinone-dependent dihydroorotate dehydrogenase [Chitinophagales bacterium]